MIWGIGTDLIHISRIEQTLKRHGIAFASRILTRSEKVEWLALPERQQARWLAKRWAAKEALAKATGFGMRAPVSWQMISIQHTPLGQPQCHFSGGLEEWIQQQGLQAHLSLSDEQDTVIAYAILELR